MGNRFVGEEPLDKVTRQYNEAMKSFLKEYGVDLVEIPRLTLKSGSVINATAVRNFLREDKLSYAKSICRLQPIVIWKTK